ncbi:MAG: aminopeptidase, partial [Pseudonocardiales bacterium]|nr:aminopeptidase [Pseudonocardiales bacterium]
MTVTNLTHAECRRRAAAVSVESYRIELDLSGAADPATAVFRSRSTIVLTARTEATWVDVIADRVVSARLNGRELDVSGHDGARLPVSGLAPGENELLVEADCRYSRSGEGLHRFTDPADGATYLYTHFEPTDARRVFAHFEQPDLKARFTFMVTAPREWRILSGQAEASRTEDGDTATVTFAPTPPQSSYLTAIAAGPYHRVDAVWRSGDGTREVALGALCRASMAEHLDVEGIFDVTRRGLDFYEPAFGVPYPWGKYDSIFVPEYNIGAMENPGLVTFTEGFLHRGAVTRTDRARQAVTILHEMAHMWFGDLVTPRWWDGTWLKESFADLMGYHVSVAATEFDDAWTAFAGRRKAWAYHADQLPTTHPIVAEVDDLEAARQNFDGITYAKGASVLKQLMAYVGQDGFFAGARDYFARHAYGSAELDDLLSCLERASGRDLQAWSRAWLQTSGMSRLTPQVQTGPDGRITRLAVAQAATDPVTGATVDRPHRLVIGLYALTGEGLRRERAVETDVVGARTEVPDAVGGPAALVLLNDDDLTYAKVRLDPHSLAAVRAHLTTVPTSLSRALIWAALWDATRDAALPAADYLNIAFGQVGGEPDTALLETVLGQIGSAIERYLPEARRAAARDRQVAACREGLAAAPAGSDAQLTWARHLTRAASTSAAGVAAVRDLLDGGGPAGLTVDADLRWDCRVALAAQDGASPAELDAALAADDTMTGRRAHLLAAASRPGSREATWQRVTTDETLTNDQLRALVNGFAHPAHTPDPQDAPRYFTALTGWWAARSQTMATVLVRGL